MRAILIAGLLVVPLAGCLDYPRSDVHGTITFQDKPLTDSTIMMLTVDNQVYRSDLAADGTYRIEGVPQGSVRVAIQQAPPRVAPRPDPTGEQTGPSAQMGLMEDGQPAPRPQSPGGPRLPESYGDPAQSGLSFELTEPVQQWSVDL